jgi:dihydrofolate synthase / folylpolyglutamate synthase
MTEAVIAGPRTLDDWLKHAERLHRSNIDMGLARMRVLVDRLELRLPMTVITVAGTNGKGSTCAMIESILLAAGYRVGVFASPHLVRFNERCRLQGHEIADSTLLPHFLAVERARAGTALTYFEFTTLAILRLFQHSPLDAVVLEVGMGGLDDAVNVIDTHCAVLTQIDIDHAEWLGPDRDSIGRVKAGIARAGQPLVVGDAHPPASVLDRARSCGSPLWIAERDFAIMPTGGALDPWCWTGRGRHILPLEFRRLAGRHQAQNAATAVAAVLALSDRLPVSDEAVRIGLADAYISGRMQVLARSPMTIVDVAHNPHAARALSQYLKSRPQRARVHAVMGALSDKDRSGMFDALASEVSHWYFCDLETPRDGGSEDLMKIWATRFSHTTLPSTATCHTGPVRALEHARARATDDDWIIAFGSFHVVGPLLAARRHGS